MQPLSKLVLIGACCWAASAQAQVGCHFVAGGFVCPTTGSDHFVLRGTYNMTAGPIPASALNWGTTDAAIQSNFAANIYSNFEANPSLDAMFSQMDPMMLARLSTELAAHDQSGYTPYILGLAASQLSAANLSYLRSAFGPTLVNAAAAAHAPAAVYSAYLSTAAAPALQFSQYSYSLGNPRLIEFSPSVGMFGYDVMLLAFTTKGFGNPAQARPLAVRYLQTHVPGVTGVHGIVFCNTVASCLTLAILAYQGAVAAGSAIQSYVEGSQFAGDVRGYMAGWYWNQWQGYVPPQPNTPPAPSNAPVPGTPTTPPPPDQEGPPSPPPPEMQGPPSPAPSDGGDVSIGGDDSNIITSND